MSIRIHAEAQDDADEGAGLRFRVHDLEHVLERERLEVEPVGGVVIGRHRLGIAIDHDGLVAGRAQRHRRVHARVVELDPLADAVRAAAENDHLLALDLRPDLGLLLVGRVEVRGVRVELGRAGVDRLVHRTHVRAVPQQPHRVRIAFRNDEAAGRIALKLKEARLVRHQGPPATRNTVPCAPCSQATPLRRSSAANCSGVPT